MFYYNNHYSVYIYDIWGTVPRPCELGNSGCLACTLNCWHISPTHYGVVFIRILTRDAVQSQESELGTEMQISLMFIIYYVPGTILLPKNTTQKKMESWLPMAYDTERIDKHYLMSCRRLERAESEREGRSEPLLLQSVREVSNERKPEQSHPLNHFSENCF